MPRTSPRRVFLAKLRLAVYASFAIDIAIASAQIPAPHDTPTSPPAPGQYVLHAYADLLRIPTLVLDRHRIPMAHLDLNSFSLQIDSGPAFHPVSMHPQNTEPMSLAIVLDASGDVADLLKALPNTPTHGLPTNLLPQDTLSIYAFDCRTFRSAMDLPTSHPALQDAMQRVLTPPRLHNPKGKTCQDKKQLWETVNLAAQDLAAQPGWRALIVLSDGEDSTSGFKWVALSDFASARSITIFGLRSNRDTLETMRVPGLSMLPLKSSEDLFAEVAGRTGGLIFSSNAAYVAHQMDDIVSLLRSRYILQFSRPVLMTGGMHHLDVHQSAHDAIVLAAGASVPARDTAILNDPTTVPMDTSRLPVVGNRKPLKP